MVPAEVSLLCWMIWFSQASSAMLQCIDLHVFSIDKPGENYNNPCGGMITPEDCGNLHKTFPIPGDCQNFMQCRNNRLKKCPCPGGNQYNTASGRCMIVLQRDPRTCACPIVITIPPSSTPTVETEVITYVVGPGTVGPYTVVPDTVRPTGGQEEGDNSGGGINKQSLYIIGSSVGGAVILILVIVVLVLCCRVKRLRKKKNKGMNLDNPEYTRRNSGIYAEINDYVEPTSASSSPGPPNFKAPDIPLPSVPHPNQYDVSPSRSLDAQAASGHTEDNAHEYQKLMTPHSGSTRTENNPHTSKNGIQRQDSEKAYMVVPLIGPPRRTTSMEESRRDELEAMRLTDIKAKLNTDKLSDLQSNTGEEEEMEVEKDPKHEYFELEGP